MHRNRKPPQDVPPPVKTRPGLMHQVRTYRLITPLFGGGAEPQKPDEITVVRASEIRGMLRFWWRAIRGGGYDTTEKLRQAEEAVWGSAAGKGKPGPSPVSLEVRVLQRGRKRHEVQVPTQNGPKRYPFGDPRSPYGYVAFPLRDSGNGVQDNVEFALHITIRKTSVQAGGKTLDVVEEVEAALWAWETFGGVGARTRRGFGALELVKVEENGKEKPFDRPAAHQVEAWIRNQLKHYAEETRWPAEVPHLHPDMPLVITKRAKNADTVWKSLFNALKSFRQARYPDRKGRPYGRSQWPEPDAIRRIKQRWSRGHEPKHPVDRKFPRGQMGLPIIFQFKDEEFGDPPKTVLQGSQHDRFASRLILRPLACLDGVVGLACVLQEPKDPPGGYILKDQTEGKVIASVPVELNHEEAKKIEPLQGEPDVLKAFLKTLKNS